MTCLVSSENWRNNLPYFVVNKARQLSQKARGSLIYIKSYSPPGSSPKFRFLKTFNAALYMTCAGPAWQNRCSKLRFLRPYRRSRSIFLSCPQNWISWEHFEHKTIQALFILFTYISNRKQIKIHRTIVDFHVHIKIMISATVITGGERPPNLRLLLVLNWDISEDL